MLLKTNQTAHTTV